VKQGSGQRGTKLRRDEQQPNKRLLWPDEWTTHGEVYKHQGPLQYIRRACGEGR
jgi:hypothetical protein